MKSKPIDMEVFMTTKVKKNYVGEVIEANGCYTNFGFVRHTTNKINASALMGIDPDSVKAVRNSQNAKVGNMHATYSPQVTCPTSCPFYPKIHGDVLDVETRMHIQIQFAEIEAQKIDELFPDKNLRIHVVGDSSNSISARIIGSAMVRYEKRGAELGYKVQAFTYTHAWNEPYNVPESDWQGARVIASCETDRDIERARELGYACELTLPVLETNKVYETKGGNKVLPCPNVFNKEVQCNDCMKCADIGLLKSRNWVIGLSTHGAFRKANKSISNKEG